MSDTNCWEHVKCPVCGSDDFAITYTATYPATVSREELLRIYSSSSEQPLQDQLVKCRACSMQYVNPRVHASIIQDSYQNAEDHTHWEQSRPRIASFKRNLDDILKRLGITPAANVRVLDVGSAGGYFLRAAMDLGLNATGVEPSRWLSERGRKELGVDLRTGTLETCAFDPGTFSLASLWDVLEHVTQPGEVLDQIHEVLAPKGHLIISYPDYASLARRLLQRKWPFFLNVHLHYFTPATLSKLLVQHGYRVLFWKPYFLTLELGYILQRATTVLPWLRPLLWIAQFLHITRVGVRYQAGQTILVAQKA